MFGFAGISAVIVAVPRNFVSNALGLAAPSACGGVPVDGAETVLSTDPAPSTAPFVLDPTFVLRVAMECSLLFR